MKRRDALLALGAGASAIAGIGWMAGPRADADQAAAKSRARRVRVYYTPDYVGSALEFETTRKARWVADSLLADPIAGIQLVANQSLSEAAVLRVHAPAYVTAVRTGQPRALAESQGFTWDPQLWPMVLASNGGVLAAAMVALANGAAGALSSGLHHARRDHGAGFCTFNGLAIAALHAIEKGARRILIIDLDAHCGGGTNSLLGENPAIHQLDVAVDNFDRYQPLKGNTLDLVEEASSYLPMVERRLDELAGRPFDLCLYNAGMDPHQDCPVGGLPGIDQEILARREQLVFSWCRRSNLPIAFVLAGGYIGDGLDAAGLVALHRLTLAAAAEVDA